MANSKKTNKSSKQKCLVFCLNWCFRLFKFAFLCKIQSGLGFSFPYCSHLFSSWNLFVKVSNPFGSLLLHLNLSYLLCILIENNKLSTQSLWRRRTARLKLKSGDEVFCANDFCNRQRFIATRYYNQSLSIAAIIAFCIAQRLVN